MFVLDFFNSVEDIQQAFEPFYTSTSLSQATDVNVLHDLKDQLDETGVYEQAEVNDFTEGYFANTTTYTVWLWVDEKSPVSAIMYIWNSGDMVYRVKK